MPASAIVQYTMVPDGSYAIGDSYTMAPDGGYVGSSNNKLYTCGNQRFLLGFN